LKPNKKFSSITPAVDKHGLSDKDAEYVLQLYITGATYNSMVAVKNVKQLCETFLRNRYKLEIIDVYQRPVSAELEKLIATPTLIKLKPTPIKRFIGDMSDTHAVLASLGIQDDKG
jgi:circadian clock protein KaiB